MTPRKVAEPSEKPKLISRFGPWCAVVALIISLTSSGLLFASNYGSNTEKLNQVQSNIVKIDNKNKDQDDKISESAADIAAIKSSLDAIAQAQQAILNILLNKGSNK